MVTAYRTGAVEPGYATGNQVNSVIFANLVIGENVVPEFLQEDCMPEKLAAALRDLLGDSAAAAEAGRGLRQNRRHHVDRQRAAQRAGGRHRAGDHATGEAVRLN